MLIFIIKIIVFIMSHQISYDDILELRVGTGRYQISTLLILAMVNSNNGCQIILMSFIVPIIGKEWDLTKLEMQTLTSAFYFGMVLGSLIIGFLADQKGRLSCLVYGSSASFLISCLFVVSDNVVLMILNCTLYGFIYGFMIPLTTSMISEVSC